MVRKSHGVRLRAFSAYLQQGFTMLYSWEGGRSAPRFASKDGVE